jgi:hypothetical protein
MLPGFRFLFAAIMLSMSLLIFGLGAAALFRAAHESFASNSTWHATPDVPFAQRPETTLPVLATLRVEPVTEKETDTAKVLAAPAAPTEAITEPMTSDQVAALPRLETPPTAIAKPELAKPADTPAPAAENPSAPEAAPAAPITIEAAATSETKATGVVASDAASLMSEPASAQLAAVGSPTTNATTVRPAASAEPATSTASTPSAAASAARATASETDGAETKIATLGGPPVEVTDSEPVPETRTVKIPRARPDESVIKKRQQARRALRRRRLAARARLLAQQQLQANPFAQQTFAQPQQTVTAAAPRR